MECQGTKTTRLNGLKSKCLNRNIYKCKSCGAVGCHNTDLVDCTKAGFYPDHAAKCLTCGKTGSANMEKLK